MVLADFHCLPEFQYRFLTDMRVQEVERGMGIEGIDDLDAIQREFGINLLL